MSVWKEKRLDELCSFISRGITPQYVEAGLPVINQKCIRDNRVNLNLCRFTNASQKIDSRKHIRYGDILINSTGTGTLGRVAIFRENVSPITADGHVTILHVKEGTSSIYLGYYLHSVEKIIENFGRGSTNQLELSVSDLSRIKIMTPDLPTQNRIADILSTYDDLIENNSRRIALLEQAAQELYKEWFVRFRFPGCENAKFENGLPSQWARVRFGSIIDIIDGDRGTNYPKQEDFLCSGYCVFLNTGNVTKNGFNFSSINYISKEKDLSLRKGKLSRNDVVLTTRGTIGNSAFYNQYVPFENIRINSGMVILRGKPGISQEYIYCLLNSEHWQKSILLYASGSAQPQLPIKDMRRIKIVKPDSSTLVAFTSITKKYYDEIALLSSKNQTLRKQQELLLPRLASGKLEV